MLGGEDGEPRATCWGEFGWEGGFAIPSAGSFCGGVRKMRKLDS